MGLAGPVEVIEHDQQGALAGDVDQYVDDGLEQAEPLRVRVTRHRLPEIRHQPRQIGDEPSELRTPRTEHGGELIGGQGVGQMGQRFGDRLVRDAQLLLASAPEHHRALVVRDPRHLGGQPRLADAWLAGHQHDPAASGGCLLPRPQHELCLAFTAHEGECVLACERPRERDRGGDRVEGGRLPPDFYGLYGIGEPLEVERTDRHELVLGPGARQTS